MIWHFIRSDFRRFGLLYPGAAILIGLLGACFRIKFEDLYLVLAYAWLFCGLVASRNALGSRIRTQGQSSRNYLLALPLSHHEIYWIAYRRSLALMLPLLILALASPLVIQSVYAAAARIGYLSFETQVTAGFFAFWTSLMTVRMQNEYVSEYRNPKYRIFWSLYYTMLWTIQCDFVAIPFLIASLSLWHLEFIPILIAAGSTAANYFYSRKLFFTRREQVKQPNNDFARAA